MAIFLFVLLGSLKFTLILASKELDLVYFDIYVALALCGILTLMLHLFAMLCIYLPKFQMSSGQWGPVNP